MTSPLVWILTENDEYSYAGFQNHLRGLQNKQNLSESNRGFLMDVYAEMSESNFLRLCTIKAFLDNVDVSDDNYVYPDTATHEIRHIGGQINSNGGLHAMRICYYTLTRILMTNQSATDLQHLWDGIGE
jgi:hypothetical protein